MRKNLKSLAPTLWFVIFAFIISIFAIWGGAGRLGEGRAANTIVTIGKEKISADQYYQELRQRLEMMKRQFKEFDPKLVQQLNIPQQVLNQIIQQTLLLQTAEELGIQASDEEIRDKIVSYPVFQKDGQFIGFDEYKKILDWNRIPYSLFEESLEKEIVMDKVIQTITSGIAVSQEELWENFKKNKESAKLEYAITELEKIELNEEADPSKLQDLFSTNQDKYKIPEKREGNLVFFAVDSFIEKVELSDTEIEKYYKDNRSRFTEPEKVRVSRIYIPYENKDQAMVHAEGSDLLERVKKGENFGELAKTYSQDEMADKDGDWGLFDWKRLSPAEQEQVITLSAGETSPVLKLEEGVAILKVTEKEPEILKSLEQVKDRIRTLLSDQKARESAEKEAARLEKAAKKERSLDVAAQKFGYSLRKTGLLKENESFEDIDPSGSISMMLFNLQENEVSSLIYTYKGFGITQLSKVEPLRPASFEEVRNDVEKEFNALKKKELALERMTEIREALRTNELEALAEEYGLEYKTAEEHKRGQYLSIVGENPEIDRLVFSLPLNEPSEPVDFETGYAIIRVISRNEVTLEDLKKEESTEKQNLLGEKKSRFMQSYLSKLHEEKSVRIKYDLFLKINSEILSKFGIEG
jgi:peptidyl-prolyl cis-trans isomerase D